jgi:hypothetical protein
MPKNNSRSFDFAQDDSVGGDRGMTASGGGRIDLFELCWAVETDGLKLEGVFPRGRHDERNWRSIGPGVEVLGFKPRAEPWIENLRLILPEAGIQSALNLEMIQFEFDHRNLFGEITANVCGSDVKAGNATAFALCFNDHTRLLFNFK